MSSSTPNTSLYIKNLNDSINKEELRAQLYALFLPYGTILDVVALKTAKMRGQAFVVFADLASATTAMRSWDGESFYDKPMHIEYAKTKSWATLKQENPEFIPQKYAAPGAKPLEKRLRDVEDVDPDTRARKKDRRANEDEQMEVEYDANADNDMPITTEERPSNYVLLCTNLPQDIIDETLVMLFQQYRGFQSSRTVAPPGSGSKIGYVYFENVELASTARQALDGYNLKPDWKMTVSFA